MRTDALLVFSKTAKSSLAASMSPTDTLGISVSWSLRDRNAFTKSFSRILALLDHWKDCTVTSRRLINISRLIWYSDCISFCISSNRAHCLSDRVPLNSGLPMRDGWALLFTSFTFCSTFIKSCCGVMLAGGLGKPRAISKAFRSLACSLSRISTVMPCSGVALDNIRAAISSARRKSSNRSRVSVDVNRWLTGPSVSCV